MINVQEAKKQVKHPNEEVKTYSFFKDDGKWYIHLTGYIERGFSKKDLEMMEGAHKLLNKVAQGTNTVTLNLSTHAFDGADKLELVDHCDAPKGGAIYLMESCNGKSEPALVWICDIALFVFGDMPDAIFVQRVETRKPKESGI